MWSNNNSNNNKTEGTPLLAPSNASGSGSTKYYFLASQHQPSRDEEVTEGIPEGATEDEFAPKQLPPLSSPAQKARKQGQQQQQQAQRPPNGGPGFWSRLFGPRPPAAGGEMGTLVKLRKAPIKIEPKVFFANERTFLAWMHLSVMLAGASIAILAFAEDVDNPFSQLYGVILLPVAIAFIVYSMYQYGRRAAMIRTRHPGPYEDTVGPAVLGVMLMVSITAQFALKLYSMTEH